MQLVRASSSPFSTSILFRALVLVGERQDHPRYQLPLVPEGADLPDRLRLLPRERNLQLGRRDVSHLYLFLLLSSVVSVVMVRFGKEHES